MIYIRAILAFLKKSLFIVLPAICMIGILIYTKDSDPHKALIIRFYGFVFLSYTSFYIYKYLNK